MDEKKKRVRRLLWKVVEEGLEKEKGIARTQLARLAHDMLKAEPKKVKRRAAVLRIVDVKPPAAQGT